MRDDEIQGVLSKIDFPLGNDEHAVSQAISQLLREGWEFVCVTKEYIRLTRTWEVDLTEGKQIGPGFIPPGDKVEEKECCSKFKYMAIKMESLAHDGQQGIEIVFRSITELNPKNDFLKGKLIEFCPVCGTKLDLYWQAKEKS